MVIIKSTRKKNLNDIFGGLNLSAFKQSRMRLFFPPVEKQDKNTFLYMQIKHVYILY